MNNINILGRLTRDVEMRYSQNESATAVANFSLAVNRRFKKEGQQDVDFINCVAFGKTAEIIEKYVVKGNQLAVTGRLAIDRYEKDGEKRNATKVYVEAITFISTPKDNQQSNQQNDGYMPINERLTDEEDLPF